MLREFHHQVRGRGHEQEGTRGQDRTACLSRRGVHALCLADGAGSSEHSEFGAQAVVEEGCRLLVDSFEQLIASDDAERSRRDILERLQRKLRQVASRLECEPGDLASTFLAVAASADRFVVVHIGDGVIGFVKDQQLRVISAPDNAEFANQTTFVTSPDSLGSTRLFRGAMLGVEGFILMSDGTSASLYDYRGRALAPACAKLIRAVGAAPARYARNPRFKKRLRRLIDTRIRDATKDDCSLGILARRA